MKWALKICCGYVASIFPEKGGGKRVEELENHVSLQQHF
jgi:hypothetical protein